MTGRLNAYAVILAGGSGTRFWPASTPERPKQLLPLAGERPLVVDTLHRADRLVGLERTFLVAGEGLTGHILTAEPSLSAANCLIEPVPRGTGPALAWAAWHLQELDPDAVMVSMHADHLIDPLEELVAAIEIAAEHAREDRRLYSLGAPPTRPETGYGYVQLGEHLGSGAYEVRQFVEKPDGKTAEAYAASGEHLWNTGIFVWRVADFLAAVRESTPEIATALPELERGHVKEFFDGVVPVSVDVGVMERASRVGVVKAAFRWDDVGVWGSLARTRTPDEAGNVVVGQARCVDASENIVWSEGGRVNLFGVSGLVVVRTENEVLVTTRDRAPDLKELAEDS
jgi:mannose-1-phosphate guanylyltransferase